MKIKIIDVTCSEVPKKFGGGTTGVISLVFENLTYGGKTDAKKFQEWATDGEVWRTLFGSKKGDIFEVTTVKNAKGYIDWTKIEESNAVEVVQDAVAPRARTGTTQRETKGAAVAGTWDLKNQLDRERFEFDKEKQALIVRQSSLSTAVAMLTGANKVPAIADVIKAASQFEAYVMGTTSPEQEPEGDFPE